MIGRGDTRRSASSCNQRRPRRRRGDQTTVTSAVLKTGRHPVHSGFTLPLNSGHSKSVIMRTKAPRTSPRLRLHLPELEPYTDKLRIDFVIMSAFTTNGHPSVLCNVSSSIRPWQAEHVLRHVSKHHVGRDRRDLVKAAFPPLAFDVVLARIAESAVRLHCGLSRVPGGFGGE
jgi:hypothetical protein